MKNMQRFLQKAIGITVPTALAFFLFVSCENGAQKIKDYDISEIYGYTFYGNITATKGETLKPSLILYDNNRAAWNMSIKWKNAAAVQCYYYAVKNSASNYTLYWFLPRDRAAALAQDSSKAYVEMQLGINSLEEVVTLRTDTSYMSGRRVPMQKQKNIKRITKAPPLP